MADPFAPKSVEPVTLMIGKFVSWAISDELDTDLYYFKYVFSKDNVSVDVIGSFEDNLWTFRMTGDETSRIVHGRNSVDLMAVRRSDNEQMICRTFSIHCFSNDADRRSHAQLMVDKIESILSGRADNDVESYSIKSRSITKMSIEELTKWREYYLAELGRSADALTGKRSRRNTLKVGFI